MTGFYLLLHIYKFFQRKYLLAPENICFYLHFFLVYSLLEFIYFCRLLSELIIFNWIFPVFTWFSFKEFIRFCLFYICFYLHETFLSEYFSAITCISVKEQHLIKNVPNVRQILFLFIVRVQLVSMFILFICYFFCQIKKILWNVIGFLCFLIQDICSFVESCRIIKYILLFIYCRK